MPFAWPVIAQRADGPDAEASLVNPVMRVLVSHSPVELAGLPAYRAHPLSRALRLIKGPAFPELCPFARNRERVTVPFVRDPVSH